MAISAALVKELRVRTGLGMMDCKKHSLRPMVIWIKPSKTCARKAH